jgi:hypothetical protein
MSGDRPERQARDAAEKQQEPALKGRAKKLGKPE